MQFTKQQLSFLKLYLNVSDTKSFLGDKINIKCIDDKIYFSLYGTDTKVITAFDNTNNETFENNYYVSKLANIINACKDNETITIEQDLIKFGKNAEYKLESMACNIETPPSKYLEILNNDSEATYNLVDVSRIFKSFISNTSEDYKIISLQNNHYVTYNDTVLAISQTNNTINETIYFSPVLLTVVDYFSKEAKIDFEKGNLELKKLQGGEFYGISFGNMNIFVEIKNSKLPYVFDEEISSRFNHKTKIAIGTEEFKSALKRIDFLTRDNIENRVYLIIDKATVKLESRDSQKGYEIVNAYVDKELVGFTTILNASYLNAIVSFLKNFNVVDIHIENSTDLSAVKICGRKSDTNEVSDFYFVHQVYEDISFKG
jgi:hypothetical protein